MLSYRHAFHAGNHADVLKHLTLSLTLDYYCQKDKPFWYIDTHAGSGFYRLNSAEAQKNREFDAGIQPIWQAAEIPACASRYIDLIRQANPDNTLKHYPGSPWLAAQLLRKTDALHLFELHPADYQHLHKQLGDDKRVRINKQDGLTGLIGLLPPTPRRAVTLIDPSYELKTDYTLVIETLLKAYKRFATGTYLLWYPVIDRQRVQQMSRKLQASQIPDILQIELCPQEDSNKLGMTGSGMFVINPPWVLGKQMQELLPWMVEHMNTGAARYTLQQISPEKT
ncbi:MAG TPA: 23S rRNA (adenine(2030)-N(6))-methyltransferase RlmJ [Candidatus Thiothrix moscowensis]|uniref:23S rRNA (adenine(2030)-N(6))-methyltransferase RlmJ n=1 Tax=unclassified Thiothrix TaxID=2636184 RepID=UPI0025F986A7|nr:MULTISPECIES: 23S rRNA (adenine(2030)-N(6))-methyltransferase RlmJ [unclassified Thiothrix]HRJ53939.1 23S rRNA (adenine(2030)-N(6))-methyltransferase RlmJ [Candidatus Thiothrix moscowensis]HRJ94021.1 23S rRNA (adenine(2030)-N(6))-methyltransferase RlmJ [Candidatus Thiothrix moscowensis]